MRNANAIPWGRIAGNVLAAVALILFFIYGLIKPVQALEHMARVRENPMEVTATVTHHREFESDDDVDYYSYICYQAEGVFYEDIRYETETHPKNLTPVGNVLTVQVSPEDPGTLLSALQGHGNSILYPIPLWTLFFTLWVGYLIRLGRSKALGSTPDQETIRQDLRLTILARSSRLFFMWVAVGYACVGAKFQGLVEGWALPAAAVCAVICAALLRKSFQDMNCVRDGNYQLHRDELVEKTFVEDSEGDTYTLVYRSGKDYWTKTTNRRYFDSVTEGSVVLAVYLPGTKKPVMHYDLDGDAC